ncbi:MAG: ribosome maturation factor RimM [Oscillospiraceae bacterium]|nr:ribosome maturation factor RimM [Oscillospiraceae bacterium]
MFDKPKLLEAGKIVNTHGIKGEIKIEPWADSPEFLTKFKKLYIGETGYKVKRSYAQKSMVIVSLEGIDDINAAMTLKNKIVSIDRGDARLPKGSFFIADIIGSRVISEEGEELGILDDVMQVPSGNIYVVKGEREILIPAVPEFIKSTSPEKGEIIVSLIEGM